MATQPPTPVFLFSLPRSGSTLLQRILAAHPDVATSSEPWVLLPLIMSRRPGAVYATYRHEDAVRAIDDFSNSLSGGASSFDRALRDFVLELYRRSASEAVRYFVDKTPRYHLIADELMHLFPEAKCIFLWRNPLSVASSLIRTWGHGRWNLFRHEVDLDTGLMNLVASYRAHESDVLALQYEELVENPVVVTHRAFEYLELDFHPEVLESFADVSLSGGMGDKTGVKYGASISVDSKDTWPEQVTSSLRKAWLGRYVDRIGQEALATMGYQKEAILESLKNVQTGNRTFFDDLARLVYGNVYRRFDDLVEWRSRRYLQSLGGSPTQHLTCLS